MEIFCLNENNEIIKNKPKIDTFFFFSFSRSHTVERNKFEAIQCSKKKKLFSLPSTFVFVSRLLFFLLFCWSCTVWFFFFKHDNVGYDLIVPHDSFVPRPPPPGLVCSGVLSWAVIFQPKALPVRVSCFIWLGEISKYLQLNLMCNSWSENDLNNNVAYLRLI